MSKFMFVVPPFFGHISPTLSVGGSLLARGHEVIWVGLKELGAEHIPAGGQFIVPHKELAPYQSAIQAILKLQDEGPKLSGVETLKLALEDTYIPFAKYMLAGVSGIADEFRPDVIISDCITFAGALCAHIKDIPCVTTTPVPPDVTGDAMQSPKIFEWQQNLIRSLQREVGIYTDEYVIHSREMNIVFTSQEFAGSKDPLPHMRFVGPVKGRPNNTPFDWDQLARVMSPKVFVSLGTLLVDIRKEFFQKLIDAFADEPITIVAATDPAIFPQWPDNFIVQGFVPQSELMPHMHAVICHGGFNTVNDAFVNGLPMLITPIAYDHFHTASLIENAGCGIKLRYKRLRVPDLKAAMWEVLDNPKYRKSAQYIRETFIKAGGNDKAVALLETFAKEKQSTLSV
ncbi:glycosyltransferase [Chitinophaga pinensis]|uniref:Glycosyltransferase, MGT family n=1 Tax=Chitinophaga pinensis (strain ATCC 43595 / DSM 2588 / LMG 13176 / NBRC 15968 / NCIMB 11800 / UQM 2034) TaxID=485918 RepID=A0A979GMV7_CHIPD|nr:nucleotide disphospho-sugar-binding domain-containing protein [Chitinophaga pinensis]ACU58942.1 glycosyltransferase, MGT family [Chitinophaga pinensis DSM 2588]